MRAFLLVGGWPGSGKTTLSRALASELGIPCLSKDVVKEALMDALGAPSTVEESRELGRAAVFAVLGAARGCQGAVIDSTWYPYSEPLVRALPGPVVEVRCRIPLDLARDRYRNRFRDERYLDRLRIEAECGAARWLRSASGHWSRSTPVSPSTLPWWRLPFGRCSVMRSRPKPFATGRSSAGPSSAVQRGRSCRVLFGPQPLTRSIVLPQQHVGFWDPSHVAGAPLVTVTSQPQFSSGHR